MRLVGFRYLQRQSLLFLTVVLLLASVLFSITAFGFFGFYQTFYTYLGEGDDVVVIYDKRSTTPFTGIIQLQLIARIENISGVLATSPEIIAPTIIKDKSVFLRGVIPEEFGKLNPLTIINGETLQLGDVQSTIVGKKLAETLHLTVGHKLLVLGVLAERYLTLEIKGTYESNSALDDEAIVPLYVGQWLRGADYESATLIRAKIDRSELTSALLYEAIAKAETPQSDGKTGLTLIEEIIPISNTAINPKNLSVKETQQFMKTYLDRYGVTPQTLLILSVIIFIFTSATVLGASHTLIRQHEHETAVLRSLGASAKTLKLDVTMKTLPWSIIASLIGVFVAEAMLLVVETSGAQALSHTIHFQLNPLFIALNILLVFMIVFSSVLRSAKKLTSK